jgi:hypothetical protein
MLVKPQNKMPKVALCIIACFFACTSAAQDAACHEKIPVIVVTDLYHPHQDLQDNVDMIMGYALPEIDLKAVVLDITNEFRKEEANVFGLTTDKGGPREPGFVPILQLNYIFDKPVPYAVGPLNPMRSENDLMTDIPLFQQEGVHLLLNTIRANKHPVDIVSTGSLRTIAVAYNREPELFKQKVRMIHISAGNSGYKVKEQTGTMWDNIPGGEWNVALDVLAFTRLLRSDLPLSLYPCAGKKGVFAIDEYSTYVQLIDMDDFVTQMDTKLQQYLIYGFNRKTTSDFLRAMDKDKIFSSKRKGHNVWEAGMWINVARRELVQTKDQLYRIIPKDTVQATDRILEYRMQPCQLEVFDDGKFDFNITSEKTNKSIYYRKDPAENEKALQQALPALYMSFKTAGKTSPPKEKE